MLMPCSFDFNIGSADDSALPVVQANHGHVRMSRSHAADAIVVQWVPIALTFACERALAEQARPKVQCEAASPSELVVR